VWAVVRLVLAALALRAGAAMGADATVPIRIVEPADLTRRGEPVTTGIPFPPGTLADGRRVVVNDPAGRPVPTQAAPLERWPDGSIRWLLVDFLAGVDADREAVYGLRLGGDAPPVSAPRLRVAHTTDGIEIDTGLLRLTVPGSGTALARRIVVAGRPIATTIPLPARAEPGEPARNPPRLETTGPVRAEVLLTGRWPDGLAYEARLAAFAGTGALRLRYTLVHRGQAESIPLRRLGVAVIQDLEGGAFGLGSGAKAVAPLVESHTLRLLDARDTRIDGDRTEARPDCWVSGQIPASTIVLVSPQCWQQYPQDFVLSPGGLRVDLLAGGDDPVPLGRGAAKTHELWIAFGPAAADAPPQQIAIPLRTPLVGHVDPAWVVRTGALSGALAPGDPGADPFLQHLRDAVRRYRARADAEHWDDGPPGECDTRGGERMRTGFYGALNWGDWNFPGYRDHSKGCDAWGNLEYDLPQVLGLGWVATGARPVWDTFVAAALHYRDVDIIEHDPEHPEWVGLNHPHKVGHFSPEARQNVDLGHTWLEGLLTHYRLTGDVRSRDAACAMGDALAARVAKAGNPRQFGWPMIALAAVAEATGEPRYRDAAVRFATPALSAFPPTPAAADWKIGILADGLIAVQSVTPDADRLAWLQAYVAALLEAPPERFADPRYALPVGVLASWTGDDRMRSRAMATASALQIGDWGKTLALWGRTGFRLLSPLAAPRTVLKPGPAGPPRGSESAPSPR